MFGSRGKTSAGPTVCKQPGVAPAGGWGTIGPLPMRDRVQDDVPGDDDEAG